MKNNKSFWLWGGGILVVLIFLFAYPKIFGNNSAVSGGGVPCINDALPLVQHIHPWLTITVDGQNETVPAEIGITAACEHALHTHDTTGELHVEAQDNRAYTLGDFFGVWGKSIERAGYALKATVDGTETANPAAIVLKDGEQIKLEYSKTN